MTERPSLTGEHRVQPPDSTRTPMDVHPDALEGLRRLLSEPEMRGVGYSEFLFRAVAAAREEVERGRRPESRRSGAPGAPADDPRLPALSLWLEDEFGPETGVEGLDLPVEAWKRLARSALKAVDRAARDAGEGRGRRSDSRRSAPLLDVLNLLSEARTALDDPAGLPEGAFDGYDRYHPVPVSRAIGYAIDRIDAAMALFEARSAGLSEDEYPDFGQVVRRRPRRSG